MKLAKSLLALLPVLASAAWLPDAAAQSMLRVACEGADVRAEVSVNGLFKGECPLDVGVSAGTVKLRVVKRIDATRERVFEDELRLGDGAVKRVDVSLSAPRLNEAAQKQAEREFGDLLKRAQAGDAASMFSVAYRYDTGRGIAVDEAQSLDWYRKAAAAGNTGAMFNLGLKLANGRGAPKDEAEAVSLYRKAAELGHVDAMASLGFMHDTGRGTPKNEAEAVVWYRKAAEQGQANAMFNLGLSYAWGTGVAKSDTEAVVWYRKAAEKGNERAIAELKKRGLM